MVTALTFVVLSAMQQVTVVTLGAADARSRDGFASIFAVHDLPDGRVLMTDNLDRVIRVADLRAGTVRDLVL